MESGFYRIEQVNFPFLDELHYQLAEKSVLPCEPFAGEIIWIINIKRLMHESLAGIGVEQHCQTLLDFIIIGRSERFHHDAHRPGHVIADMRATYALTLLPTEEIRVAVAPHETARILVYRVVDIHLIKIRHCKKAGHISIIHQQMVAESVNLESINSAEFRMIICCMFLKGCFNLVGQGGAFGGKIRLPVNLLENLCSLAERSHGKEIRRDKELERGSVVRRTETRNYQTARFHRSTPTVIVESIESPLGLTLETV